MPHPPCAAVLPTGGLCGAKWSAPVHLHTHPAFHAYEDPSKVGIKGKSDGRLAYEASAAHKEAMALSVGAHDCWPAAYGAPGDCYGPLTPSHTLSRSKAGGLKAADAYPVPPACARHNAALQDDAETRAWATSHFFTFNGRDWPFLITDAYLQAERERGVQL